MGQATEKRDKEKEVMRVFFESPAKRFTIRELEKISKIPRTTVHKYLSMFKKIGLVDEDNMAIDSLLFRTKKINYFMEEIVKSGLVDYLIENLNPSCIILFGSIRKGDSVGESDIDIFVESFVKKRLDLKKFEKKLKHKIQLFVESDINNLQDNLKINVYNGIKLYGNFRIK